MSIDGIFGKIGQAVASSKSKAKTGIEEKKNDVAKMSDAKGKDVGTGSTEVAANGGAAKAEGTTNSNASANGEGAKATVAEGSTDSTAVANGKNAEAESKGKEVQTSAKGKDSKAKSEGEDVANNVDANNVTSTVGKDSSGKDSSNVGMNISEANGRYQVLGSHNVNVTSYGSKEEDEDDKEESVQVTGSDDVSVELGVEGDEAEGSKAYIVNGHSIDAKIKGDNSTVNSNDSKNTSITVDGDNVNVSANGVENMEIAVTSDGTVPKGEAKPHHEAPTQSSVVVKPDGTVTINGEEAKATLGKKGEEGEGTVTYTQDGVEVSVTPAALEVPPPPAAPNPYYHHDAEGNYTDAEGKPSETPVPVNDRTETAMAGEAYETAAENDPKDAKAPKPGSTIPPGRSTWDAMQAQAILENPDLVNQPESATDAYMAEHGIRERFEANNPEYMATLANRNGVTFTGDQFNLDVPADKVRPPRSPEQEALAILSDNLPPGSAPEGMSPDAAEANASDPAYSQQQLEFVLARARNTEGMNPETLATLETITENRGALSRTADVSEPGLSQDDINFIAYTTAASDKPDSEDLQSHIDRGYELLALQYLTNDPQTSASDRGLSDDDMDRIYDAVPNTYLDQGVDQAALQEAVGLLRDNRHNLAHSSEDGITGLTADDVAAIEKQIRGSEGHPPIRLAEVIAQAQAHEDTLEPHGGSEEAEEAETNAEALSHLDASSAIDTNGNGFLNADEIDDMETLSDDMTSFLVDDQDKLIYMNIDPGAEAFHGYSQKDIDAIQALFEQGKSEEEILAEAQRRKEIETNGSVSSGGGSRRS